MKETKREICELHEPIAYYSGLGGLEVRHIECGINDYLYLIAGTCARLPLQIIGLYESLNAKGRGHPRLLPFFVRSNKIHYSATPPPNTARGAWNVPCSLAIQQHSIRNCLRQILSVTLGKPQ